MPLRAFSIFLRTFLRLIWKYKIAAIPTMTRISNHAGVYIKDSSSRLVRRGKREPPPHLFVLTAVRGTAPYDGVVRDYLRIGLMYDCTSYKEALGFSSLYDSDLNIMLSWVWVGFRISRKPHPAPQEVFRNLLD